jgi:hypothetical protein
VIKGK